MLCGSWSVIKSFRWKGSSFKRSFQHFVFIFSCSMAWNTLKTYYYFHGTTIKTYYYIHNHWISGGIRGKDILNWIKKYKLTSSRIIQKWLNGARIGKDSMQGKGWTLRKCGLISSKNKRFFSSPVSGLAVRPIQPPTKWALESLSPGTKQLSWPFTSINCQGGWGNMQK